MSKLVVFFCKSCVSKIACEDGTKLRRCKDCDIKECPVLPTTRTSDVLTCFECIQHRELEDKR